MAESWVEVPDDGALVRATAILGEAAEVVALYEGRFAPGEVQAVCGLSQSDRGLRAAARPGIVFTEEKHFGSTPLEPSATVGGGNRRIWPV